MSTITNTVFDKYLRFHKFTKRLRKKFKMAKNERKKGRSARNGNAPAPYTKYQKQPYKYSASITKQVIQPSSFSSDKSGRGTKRVYEKV